MSAHPRHCAPTMYACKFSYIYHCASSASLTNWTAFMPHPGIGCAEGSEETFRMEDQIEWVRLFLSWVPFIAIIIAWFVITRFFRQRAASGATMIELYEQQVTETRR